ASSYLLDAARSTEAAVTFYERLAEADPLDLAFNKCLPLALLELWVRPAALANIGPRGNYQFVAPYRGLFQFEARDADIYFGRSAEVAEVLALLKDEKVVTVAGDSGSGKSSLLRAGVVASVRKHGLLGRADWRIALLRPGSAPGHNLAASLMG